MTSMTYTETLEQWKMKNSKQTHLCSHRHLLLPFHPCNKYGTATVKAKRRCGNIPFEFVGYSSEQEKERERMCYHVYELQVGCLCQCLCLRFTMLNIFINPQIRYKICCVFWIRLTSFTECDYHEYRLSFSTVNLFEFIAHLLFTTALYFFTYKYISTRQWWCWYFMYIFCSYSFVYVCKLMSAAQFYFIFYFHSEEYSCSLADWYITWSLGEFSHLFDSFYFTIYLAKNNFSFK